MSINTRSVLEKILMSQRLEGVHVSIIARKVLTVEPKVALPTTPLLSARLSVGPLETSEGSGPDTTFILQFPDMTRAIFSSNVSPGDASLTTGCDDDTLLELEDDDGVEEI